MDRSGVSPNGTWRYGLWRRCRLTGGHGWVVAAYGSDLAYRTSADGDWIDGGTDAALLPDAATQVRVTRPGQAEAVVPLAR